MVDNPDGRSPGPGRQAVLRHRRHRFPRHRPGRAASCAAVPDAEVGRARAPRPPGQRRRSGWPARSCATTASTASAPSSASASTTRSAGAWSPSPATSAATASASTTTAGGCWPPATSSSTRPPPSASTPRSTRRSRSTCSARPGWRRPMADAAPARQRPASRPAHLIAVSTAYVAGTHQGEASEELLCENRFTLDVDWEAEVGQRPAAARRPAGRVPPARPAGRASAKQARAELGAAGDHLLAARAEQLREEWVKRQLVEAGTARAQALGWPDAYPFTKALGERALVAGHGSAPHRPTGGADHHRAPLDHRVGAGRAAAGLDPRLPHGRADHHLLRPGPAAGVPRRPRGRHRRHPGRPGGRGHHRRRRHRPRPRADPTVFHVASGVAQPAPLRPAGRAGPGLVRPSTRSTTTSGQPIERPRVVVPGPGPGPAPARSGPPRPWTSLERAAHRPAVRGRQAELRGPARGPQRAGRAGPRLRRALRRLHRDRGPLPGRPPARPSGTPSTDEDRAPFCFDPAVIDWDHYVHDVHLPSVVEHARVRTTPGALGGRPAGPTGPARASSPPDRHLAVFDLEHTLSPRTSSTPTPGWPAATFGRPAGRLRGRPPRREAPALLALDRRDRGDFLRSFYRRYEDAPVDRARARTPGSSSTAAPHPVVPGRPRPGPRAPAPRPPHPAHHRRPRLRGRPAAPALRRRRLRPPRPAATGASTGASRSCPRSARPGPSCSPTTPPPTGSPSPSRSPTPTRPATWPCSRRSASPSPSTPRPGWPPSPAGGAGTSSTGQGRRRLGPAAPPRSPRPRSTASATGGHRWRPPPGPSAAAGAAGEGARLRAQPAPLRRRPGRLGLGSGRGAGVGPAAAGRRRRPRAARARTGTACAPLLSGICGSDLATLDGRSSRYFEDLVSFPFVPGHEVVGTVDRRHGADGAAVAAGTGSCSSRCSAARPGASTRRARPAPTGRTGDCEQRRLRPPAARAADRLLRRHRRRLVDRRPGRPPEPAPPRARRARPTTTRSRSSRSACAVHAVLGAGLARRRRRSPCSAPAPSAWPSPPPSATWPRPGASPAPRALLVGARYAHQRRLAAELGATAALPGRPARPGRPPPQPLARPGRPGAGGQRLTGGADVVFDCVGSAESIAQSLAMVRPRGRVVLVGHARPGPRRPGLRSGTARSRLAGAYAYGTETGRRRDRAGAHLRPRLRGGRRAADSAGWCRPPTRSSASRRPSPTPARPAGAARSRSPSTCADGDRHAEERTPDEPQARVRARGRPLDPAHAVLARRGFAPRAAARGQPGRSTPPSRSTPLRRPGGGHPPRPDAPARRQRAAAGAAAAGHEAHDLLRRRLAAAAADAGARRPPAGHRAGARHGRRGRRRRRRAHRRPGPAPPDDRGRAAPRPRRPGLRRLRPARPAHPARRRGPRQPRPPRARPTRARTSRSTSGRPTATCWST